MLTEEDAVETGETGAEADAVSKAGKRRARLKKMTEANKITFSLETDVRRFIQAEAKAAGMDVGHYMQKIVESHVLEAAPANEPLSQRLAAKRAVIDYAVALAQKLDADGGFDEHFILSVMKKASEDPEFKLLYEKAVGEGEKGAKAAHPRIALNQQLGRLIKKAAGAKSKRNDAGRIARAQVSDEMIKTYTLLEKAAA